jgi:hypothetical protein
MEVFGVDPQMAYQATKSVTQQQQVSDQAPQQLTPEQEEASEFVGQCWLIQKIHGRRFLNS